MQTPVNRKATAVALNAAIVIAFAVLALLFWKLRIIDPARDAAKDISLTNVDFYTQIYPMAQAAGRSIRDGTIPLWNPFQLCGYPFLATVIYGVLYPFNVAYLFLPTHVAIEATIVLHIFAAGLFMYLFTRGIPLGRPAAFSSATIFMWSGILSYRAGWFPPALASAVWLPLAFLAIDRIFERRSLGSSMLLGVAVGMPILAGWLQTWTYAMYAIGGYAVLRLVADALRHRRAAPLLPSAVLLATGLLLGVALAAAQLLPSFELRSAGPRKPGGLSVEQMLVTGGDAPEQIISGAVDPTPGFPRKSYLGMATLLLMPLSLFSTSRRVRLLWLWLLAIGSMAVALSIHQPFFEFYRALPTVGWFREPQRILYLYAFAGSVLAGIGLEALSRLRADARRRGALGVATLTALVVSLTTPIPIRGLLTLWIGLAAIWATALLPTARLRSGALLGLVGLLAGDLFLATSNPYRHPYHDTNVLHNETPVFEFIQQHQGFDRTYIAAGRWAWGWPWVMAKQGVLRQIYGVTDYEPLSLDRYAKFYRLLEAPFERQHAFSGALLTRPDRPNFRLLDLMSVRFMVVAKLAPKKLRGALLAKGWRPVFRPEDGDFLVVENPDPLPRAYVVYRTRAADGEAAALQAISERSFDFRNVAVLESPDVATPRVRRRSVQKASPARIVRYDPTRVVVELKARWPGHLILTDTFYPGWKATLNGSPTPILRANYLFRGVAVPAGEHTVTFRYEPLSFSIGATLSAAATALLIAALILGVRRARREAAPIGSSA
jgi:hypothetical protein